MQDKGDSIRLRIMEVRRQFKRLGVRYYLNDFLIAYPQYNNLQGISRVRTCMNFSTVDRDITEHLEAFVESLKQKAYDISA